MAKILTVESLLQFCEQNHINNFDSHEQNVDVILNIPATFETQKESEDKYLEGLLPFTSKAFHDHTNLNASNIEEETFKEEMPSANFRPILANYVENKDGELDFGAHDYHIVEEDGEKKIVYDEQPIGAIDGQQTTIEYDEKAEVNRAILHGYIFAEYCDKAVEILERRGVVDCSVELAVRKFSYDAEKKVINLDSYSVQGLTLLGADHKPGMAGSDFKLDDVTKEEFAHKDKLVEILEKLESTLSSFDTNQNMKKGGKTMTKFEELLQKYGKTVEDITFDYESLSDEELETAFAEAFDEHEPEPESIPEIKFSVAMGEMNKEFSLSLDDKRRAAYQLVSATYDDDWYAVNMFDEDGYLEMYGWFTEKNYRQSFTREGDVFALTGERVEIFAKYLTQEEIDKLEADKAEYEALKTEYEVLKQYKENKEFEIAHNERMQIIAEYSSIENTDEYKSLVENIDSYSKEEIVEKADAIVGKYARQGMQFSFSKKEEAPARKPAVKLSFKEDTNNNTPAYGGIFD